MLMNAKILILVLLTFLTSSAVNAMSSKKKQALPQISVQLYSVRYDVKDDFKGSLKAIAEMGFEGVEFAGDYGPYQDDPKALKAFLSSLGLQASGVHIKLDDLNTETAAKYFQFYNDLGTKLVIIPIDDRSDDPERIDELIAEMNVLSAMATKAGLTLGFHNHGKEFKAFKDTTFWDHIAQNTERTFSLQLDVGWVNLVGADPIEYVKRYPQRTQTTHYKVRTRDKVGITPTEPVTIGEDDFDWAKLIETNMRHGDTQWIVVEQEEFPEGLTPMQSVAASKKGLDAIIKKMGY